MKKLVATLIIFCYTNHHAMCSLNEKTPLLSAQQKKSVTKKTSSLDHIREALAHLKKIQPSIAKQLHIEINKNKDFLTRKKIVQKHLERFKKEAKWIKENCVFRDKHGNLFAIQSHPLDPVIAAFEKYLGITNEKDNLT